MPNDQDQPDDAQPKPVSRPRTEPIRLMPDGFGRLDVLRAKREKRYQAEEVGQTQERTARAEEETPTAPLNALPSQPDDEIVVVEDANGPWLGREKTMLPQSKPAADDAWLGREKTMLPQSKAPAEMPAEWTGAEQTMVGGAAPAAPSEAVAGPAWLGREQTMVPQSKPEGEWTGSEQTVVGMGAGGAWLGREKTMIGIDGDGAAKKSSGETSHGSANRKPTSPTLVDGWHLKGRKGALTGKTVGDYDVGGILGEGGMGTVYRARQISLKRRVALKVLPSNLSGDARLRERFEQEARTASLINSIHVVQVFAAGQADDIVYFAMEYVEGTDLAAVIDEKAAKNEKFTPEEAASYIIQAGKGLAEAGRHGIVHRDIKPPNLMITAHGVVKIADFGISKVAGEHSLTMTGTAVGTPAYVSPEQGRGDSVDSRSDLYSLGVVMYELLVGQKPFDGATANALIYQHNYAEPKLLKELRPDLPDEYQAVALKCLQKDPAKRYQSADELVQDLERIRAGSAPMTAMMEVFGTGADEAMRRLGIKQTRLWPYLVAAVLFLALAGGIGAWWMDRRGEVARLRTALAPLGESKPVYAGAGDDLDVLAGYVGDDDADVTRWRQKFTRVDAVGKRLARLDEATVVDAALRAECERDLGDYASLIGGQGPLYERWTAALAAADARLAELRARLAADLDGPGLSTVAQRDGLEPQLGEFTVRGGVDDPDTARWQEKFTAFDSRLVDLRGRLAALDGDESLDEQRLVRLRLDLDAFKRAIGDGDRDHARWELRLRAAGETIAGLRQSLARLDSYELPPATLVQAVGNDLATYKSLVDAQDSDLKKWTLKCTLTSQTMAGHRARLARLDDDKGLTMAEIAAAGDSLTKLIALAGDDDAEGVRWSTRLRAENDRIATLRESIARLDRPDPLTVEQQDAAAAALADLDARGALNDSQKRAGLRRLGEERERLVELRARLSALDRIGPLPKALADDLAQAVRLIGEQDVDVKRWNAKAGEVARLRARLAPLDQAASPPGDAAALLDRLAAQLGDDDGDVVRWRGKATRVGDLGVALAHLDQRVAIAPEALGQLAEYTALVGAEDASAARWNAKATRVGELKAALAALPRTYVLPAEAPAQVEELVGLLGADERDCAAWSKRVAVLTGPSAPAWAAASGRDQHGLWADLKAGQIVQRFRYVPAGTFTIGSPDKEPGREKDETRCEVTLTQSFWLADSECVQGLWEAIGVDHDSRFRSPERPVERASRPDCQRFLDALNRKISGLEAKLPTEAQWEYACRAGSTAPYASWTGEVEEKKLEAVAWSVRNATSTKEVKRRQPNTLGLFDMHGNVWEWCSDRYGTYSPTAISDPVGREEDTYVARGGSWGDQPAKLRAANRLAVMPDLRTLYLGMRILMPAAPVEAQKLAGNP